MVQCQSAVFSTMADSACSSVAPISAAAAKVTSSSTRQPADSAAPQHHYEHHNEKHAAQRNERRRIPQHAILQDRFRGQHLQLRAGDDTAARHAEAIAELDRGGSNDGFLALETIECRRDRHAARRRRTPSGANPCGCCNRAEAALACSRICRPSARRPTGEICRRAIHQTDTAAPSRLARSPHSRSPTTTAFRIPAADDLHESSSRLHCSPRIA